MNDFEKPETLIEEDENEKLYWESLRGMFSSAPIALLGKSALPTDMKAGSCADVSFRAPQVAYLSEVLK